LALEFERSLLESLSPGDRATLDRLLDELTTRAESLAVDLREAGQAARIPRAPGKTRRAPAR
jgi:hypothetical protein